MQLGADFSLGHNGFTGLIGEVVAYSGTLTAAQAAQVDAYLMAKWEGVGAAGGTNYLPAATAVSLTASGATLNLGYVNQTIASLNGVQGTASSLASARIRP